MQIYCVRCKKTFEPKEKRQDRPAYFCSRICSVKYRSGERHPLFKGGTISNGYKAIRREVNGRSKVLKEHRYIVESKIGRPLRADEHVHHIDGNKLNNSPENLQIVSPSDHNRIHGGFKTTEVKCCAMCREIKKREDFPLKFKKLVNHDPHKPYCRKCLSNYVKKYKNKSQYSDPSSVPITKT